MNQSNHIVRIRRFLIGIGQNRSESIDINWFHYDSRWFQHNY